MQQKPIFFFGSPELTEYLETDALSDSALESNVSNFSRKPNSSEISVTNHDNAAIVPPAASDSAKVQPLIQILHGEMGNSVSARVLARLGEAESRELDVWLKDDYRIAALTVMYASEDFRVWGPDNEGDPFGPWEMAFCVYLGKHPKKLIPFFLERAEEHRNMTIADYDPTLKKKPSPAITPRKKASNA